MLVEEQEIVVSQEDAETQSEKQAFTRKASRLDNIPLSLIVKSDSALRGVQRQTEPYQLLLQSVKQRGVLNSITVREEKDPITGTIKYMLIDGLQRLTAATDAGLPNIPCNIVSMDDAELLEAQLITNLQKIQTKPAEVSKHLLRMLARNPFLTKAQLAERVCQSATWVDERLALNDLVEGAKDLVNNGQIHLTNAYMLAKLPVEEQAAFVDDAMTESPKTFVPKMKERIKQLKEAARTGKDASEIGFTPVMHLQKMSVIKEELEKGAIAEALVEKLGVTNPVDAFKLALKWALNYDPVSQEEQKKLHEEREAKKKADKERIAAERKQQKEAKAAEAKADIVSALTM
jgi:ParB/RepB/Spo0J family partition protein